MNIEKKCAWNVLSEALKHSHYTSGRYSGQIHNHKINAQFMGDWVEPAICTGLTTHPDCSGISLLFISRQPHSQKPQRLKKRKESLCDGQIDC